ncbi:MAG TPA: class I SAM-dependent methyltransferase [Chryseolinea sp.]|nr:class I SAM-dependent methyltransferase [Chryseolinea sp.]
MFWLILNLLSLSVGAQDEWKNIYRESAWKERDEWQRPSDLIKLLAVKPGYNVADIGCHEGYMTIKLASAVTGNGKVYGVDVKEPALTLLKKHLEERAIANVTLIKGDYDDPKLPANTLDGVIILDTYHEMDDHDKMLLKIKEALKPGGRLLICDPIAEERRKLSRQTQEKSHELGIAYALEDLSKAGYKVLYQKDPYVDRKAVKGDMMWVIVAVKK